MTPRLGARTALVGILASILGTVAAACSPGPPQIVDYSPSRGSQSVPTNADVTITFDRPMDQTSVAARLHLVPQTPGYSTWPDPRRLVFVHDRLRTDADYRVVLDAGYRDRAGNVNSLTHSWRFHSEPAPTVTGFSPATGDSAIDPVSYLSVSFSRAMDPASVGAAITLDPGVQVTVRADPADARRVIIAPASVLEPNQAYRISVGPGARDVDGNPLAAAGAAAFSTGPVRPLHGWLGFVAAPGAATDGSGIWIVDAQRFPRRIADGPVANFSWAPDGMSLLVETSPDGSWSELPIGGVPAPLSFHAQWATSLGRGRGYVYLDAGRLELQRPDGVSEVLAQGVGSAALAAGADRVAFTVAGPGGTAIRGLSLDIRAQYQLAEEAGTVSGLTWSPDGTRLAYLIDSGAAAGPALRVRSLAGPAPAVTVAAGPISDPVWEADSAHMVFTAVVDTAAGRLARAFSISTSTASLQPPAGPGMPSALTVSVAQPQPSTDGHQIAFLATSNGRNQVWIMNGDGTGAAPLTRYDAGFPYSCRALRWTPT